MMANPAAQNTLPASLSLAELRDRLAAVSDIYASKFNVERTKEWYLLKAQEELGELTAAYLKSSNQTRTKISAEEADQNLRDEMADVLSFLLLFAREMNIDVEDALHNKWLHYLDQN
jgi:NTP pyrophosphatase (non-canonical NTP hydrolase)